jgi:transcriptional activator SPT7
MQKKVKTKQYKSKREFKDDLDLIWSNCFTYNATEVRSFAARNDRRRHQPQQNHPLRQCATRLKAKAEKLLKNITDRKERVDPPVPLDISRGGTPKLNGTGVNGHSVPRTRPVAFTKSPSPTKVVRSASIVAPRRDAPFPDQPAIVRTVEGMTEFAQLDQELDARLNGEFLANGLSGPSIEERLREYAAAGPDGDGSDAMAVDGEVGEKRKL